MENIVYYCVIGAECLLSIILFFSGLSARKNRKLDNIVNSIEIKVSHIKNLVPMLVAKAEELFGAGNGAAKRLYVLNEIRIQCLQQSVDFDEQEFDKVIDDVLSAPQKKLNKEVAE